MTFPLGSLGAAGARPPSGAGSRTVARGRLGLLLLAAAAAWLLLVLALLTHSAADPAFSTSGSGAAVRNRAGALG
ncbi:MAG: DNA translocase FtsK 4TM domain-containing protein, partial [Rubrivivax sp.]